MKWLAYVYKCLTTPVAWWFDFHGMCSSKRNFKFHRVCPIEEWPHEHLSLYTTLLCSRCACLYLKWPPILCVIWVRDRWASSFRYFLKNSAIIFQVVQMFRQGKERLAPRARESGPTWPKRPPLMTSLTKKPHPPSKKFFFKYNLLDWPIHLSRWTAL